MTFVTRITGLAWLVAAASAPAALTITQQTLTLDLASPITPAAPGVYANSPTPLEQDLGPCVVESSRVAQITTTWDASSITFATRASATRQVLQGDASGNGFGDGFPITAIALAVVRFTVSEPVMVAADFQQEAFTALPGTAGPAYRLTDLSSGIDLISTNNPADAAGPAQTFALQPGVLYEFQLCSLTQLAPASPGVLALGSLEAAWTSQLVVIPAPATGLVAASCLAAAQQRRRRRPADATVDPLVPLPPHES